MNEFTVYASDATLFEQAVPDAVRTWADDAAVTFETKLTPAQLRGVWSHGILS